MKTLHILNLTRLTILEFGQHIKTVIQNIAKIDDIVDAVLLQYLTKSKQQMEDYDKAMLQIRKSDETTKIVLADEKRDRVITMLQRQLKVYEVSDEADELEAHASLKTVIKVYTGLQKWNFEEETNGIENLLVELNNSKYTPHVALLNMTKFVNRLEIANNSFKLLFDNRIQEVADKEVFNTKLLRAAAKETYTDMIKYVLAMAKAKDNDEFNKSLDMINSVRKYYADLLAKRKPKTTPDTDDEIPPMPQ